MGPDSIRKTMEGHMFERILIPLDGSALAECVLPHGLSIAAALGAGVTLVEVVDQAGEGGRTRPVDLMEWQFLKAEAESYLQGVAERMAAGGITPNKVMLEGPSAVRVIDYAEANNVDLIVLSSHGRSGLSGWNVSSVVQKILLRAHTSVLLVPAYRPLSGELVGLRYRRVLVPLDGSDRAECVLAVVTDLAEKQGAEVLLAHVVRRPELPRQATASREDLALADQMTERNRAEADRYLSELRSHLALRVAPHLIVSNNVANALQELVEREHVDLVALSAHGYSGSTGRPFGSLTMHMITYGSTPLLVYQDLEPGEIAPTAAEIAVRQQQRPAAGQEMPAR